MKTIQFKIQSFLQIENILFHLNHFISYIKKPSNNKQAYLYLLIKLTGKDDELNTIHYSLGRRIPIHIYDDKDIQNLQSNIKKSIFELNDYYLHITLESILFNYTILTLEQYLTQKSLLNKVEKPLNLKKESLLKKLSYSQLPIVYNQYSTEYKDTRISKGLFKRVLNNGIQLFYKNNKIDLLLKEVEGLKMMSQFKINNILNDKIMTLDI